MGVFDSDDEVVKRTIGDARAARLRARGATVTRSLVTGSPRVLARTLDRGTKRLLELRGGLAAPGGGGEEEGGGGEEWLPEGATLYADFMEAHYYAGGEEVTVDEFLDDNDPSGITSDGTQANAGVHAPKLSAAARGSIAANDCCIVIEFRTPATLNNSRTLLTINNFEPDGDDADDSDKIEVSVEDTTSLYASHFNGDYDNIGGLSVDTTYRLALNFSGSGDIKASLNGGAIVTTSGPALAEWDIVQVGFQESAPIANPTNASLAFQGHIRKLEGYAQQDDAGLMSKSTVA